MYVGLIALLITDQIFCSVTFFGSVKKLENCARGVESISRGRSRVSQQ